MRILLLLAILLVGMAAGPRAGHAQTIQLDLGEVPLEDALAEFSRQTGVDLVFALRLVQKERSTCRYEGQRASEALDCLLEHTDLEARQVRRRQFVLVPAGAPGDAPERGSIAGTVIDAETHEVLLGAHVYLPELRWGATTNQAGYFILPSLPQGTYRIRISYLGYLTRDTSLTTGTDPFRLSLTPTALEASGVTVEAESIDRDMRAPGLVSMSMGELETMPSRVGERDLFQALQWTPGVGTSGELRSGLIVQGGTADQNLYLLDGAPVYHPWHAFNLVSTFQTETLKDVKLYRGSFPAWHGGRLVSVLDAQLRDGTRAEPRAEAGLSVLSGRFLIESPLTRNSSFMLSGRRSYLDKIIGREHPVEDLSGARDTLRTGYYFSDLSAKLTLRPSDRQRLSLSYYTGRDVMDLRLPFDFSLEDFSSWLRPADLFFEVAQHWGNEVYSLQYQHLLSKQAILTTTAYRSSYRAVEGNLIQPTRSAIMRSQYEVYVRDHGLKVDLDLYASLSHELQVGAQVVDHRFDSALDALVQRSPQVVDSLSQTSRMTALELAGYVQHTWKPSARLSIQPGVRLNYFSGGAYLRPIPSLIVHYAVHPRYLVLHGSAGMQVQFMQRLRDRYSFMYDLVSSRWIPTSERVRPSTSRQASLEAESRPFSWLTLTSEVYWRSSKDILLPRDAFQEKDNVEGPGIEVGTLLEQYTSGLALAYGIEHSAHIARGPWQVRLSYAGGRSLSRAPDLDETHFRPSRYDVPRTFNATALYRFPRWEIGASTLWRSGFPVTVPEARYAIQPPGSDEPAWYLYRPDINNGRLPVYLRFDVTLGHHFTLLGANWLARLHVYNVTNRSNVIDRLYQPDRDAVVVKNRYGLPLLPLFELEMEL